MDLEDGYNLDQTLGQFFFENFTKHGSKVVQYISDTDEADLYQDLLLRSIRTALTLRNKNGIKPGDIVGLCAKNHKNSCVPLIATQFLRAINANLDFNQSHTGMIRLLQLMEPKVMFVDADGLPLMEECLSKAEINVELIVFGRSDKYCEFNEYLKPRKEEIAFKPIEISSNKNTAMILFSSGTTGFPKGVCLSHYTLLKQGVLSPIFKCPSVHQVKDIMVFSSLSWVSAVISLIKAVATASSKITGNNFDPFNTWKLIEKYKVGVVFMVPHMAAELLANRPENVDVSSLKTLATGASLVTKKLMEDLKRALPGVVVTQGYGQTEVGGMITAFDVADPKDVELQNKKLGSCGKMWKGYQWKIVDVETEERLGPFQKGELRVKSNFMMNGYYKTDASSAFDSEGYLKTGDILYYDEENCFFVVDRIKEMFKCRGAQIVPAVLEEVLLSHPGVNEAVVIGVPHELDGHHPMAYVVLKDNNNENITAEDIEKFVEKRVYDAQKLRAGVKIIDELPKGHSGKIARNMLKNNSERFSKNAKVDLSKLVDGKVPPNLRMPYSVDWREENGVVSEVPEVEECNAAWAINVVSSIEAQNVIKNDDHTKLSVQELVDCSDFGDFNSGCDGGYVDYAFDYITEKGIFSNVSYPWRGETSSICADYGDDKEGKFEIKSYKKLTDSLSVLQVALAYVGPVVALIDARFIQDYNGSDVFYTNDCISSDHSTINHPVLVVGYSDLTGNGYWIVRNSWGTSWGDEGYLKLSKLTHHDCGVTSHVLYPIIDEK